MGEILTPVDEWRAIAAEVTRHEPLGPRLVDVIDPFRSTGAAALPGLAVRSAKAGSFSTCSAYFGRPAA